MGFGVVSRVISNPKTTVAKIAVIAITGLRRNVVLLLALDSWLVFMFA